MTVVRTVTDFVPVWRARMDELGLTHQTVDAITGLPDGYTSKIMCGMKKPGPKAIEFMNGALGIAFEVAIDPEQVERVRRSWVQRVRPQRASMRASIQNEVPMQIEISAEMAAKLARHENLKRIGRIGANLGGKARALKLSPYRRRMIARKAAKERWRRRREADEAKRDTDHSPD